MKKYFPQYVSKYSNMNKGVAKADVARLVYMYAFGGWYCDTDYKWITSPCAALESYNTLNCVLPISRDAAFRLGNAVFGSEPKCNFWRDFIDYIFQSDELTSLAENRIMEVTRPEGLTEFYLAHNTEYPSICLLHSKCFHPQLKGVSAHRK